MHHLEELPIPLLAAWLQEGTVIPFLGPDASTQGMSAEYRIPAGQALSDELIQAMGPAYVGKPDDRLAKVAQVFEHSVAGRQDLHEFLHDRLIRHSEDVPLPPICQLLANLPANPDKPMIIYTTNYDTELERAFRAVGRPLYVITQRLQGLDERVTQVLVQGPNGPPQRLFAQDLVLKSPGLYPPDSAFLYKIHGSAHWNVDDDQFSIIVTEDDHADFLVQCSAYVPPPALAAEFRRRRFLFLGTSLDDWTLRVILRILQNRGAFQQVAYAVQAEPSQIEEKLWSQRRVTLYNGDLSELSARLNTELQGVE